MLCIISWYQPQMHCQVPLKYGWKILSVGRTLSGLTSLLSPGKRGELVDGNKWFSQTVMEVRREGQRIGDEEIWEEARGCTSWKGPMVWRHLGPVWMFSTWVVSPIAVLLLVNQTTILYNHPCSSVWLSAPREAGPISTSSGELVNLVSHG